jgi:hypothetical protein
MPLRIRTCVKEKRFERELAAIQPVAHLADELIAGVEFVLAREPRTGVQLAPKCPVWFIATDESEASRIGVFYAFNANEVILLSVTQASAAQ